MAVRMRSLLRVSASIGALIVLIAAMVWTSRQETVSVLMDGVGESPTYKGPMVPEVGQDVDIEEANVEENLPLGQLLEIIPEEPAVEMSLETQELMASLEYELDTWTTLVESKLNHTIPNLQREIDRFVQDLIMQCDNGTWSGLMAEFDAIERNESSQLESFVEDISCVGR